MIAHAGPVALPDGENPPSPHDLERDQRPGRLRLRSSGLERRQDTTSGIRPVPHRLRLRGKRGRPRPNPGDDRAALQHRDLPSPRRRPHSAKSLNGRSGPARRDKLRFCRAPRGPLQPRRSNARPRAAPSGSDAQLRRRSSAPSLTAVSGIAVLPAQSRPPGEVRPLQSPRPGIARTGTQSRGPSCAVARDHLALKLHCAAVGILLLGAAVERIDLLQEAAPETAPPVASRKAPCSAGGQRGP